MVKNCIQCNYPLKIGDFAYDQCFCWTCFKENVLKIAYGCKTIEDRVMITHLLEVCASYHHEKL